MTPVKLTATAVLFVMSARTSAAQPPPRPTDLPRSVTLSLAEYNRLVDLGIRPSTGPVVAPVVSVLAKTDLRVRVERESARGVFALTGEVLRPGISRVNLLSGGTVIDASVGGRPLPLMVEGNAHSALLPGPGPFAVSLEWGTALTFAPGRASFVLPVPSSGAARATIDLPGEQADVRLSAGLDTSIDGRRANGRGGDPRPGLRD